MIDHLWQLYQRGAITRAEFEAERDRLTPRCTCGTPTNASTGRAPICADCLRALYTLTTDGHERVARGRL